MGTSSAYGGPSGGTPLVPSWLGGDASPTKEGDSSVPPDGSKESSPASKPVIPPNGDSLRFRRARADFSRYARSGGSDRRSMGRAIARYVSVSVGGARQAAQRMGVSRDAGAQILSFLTDVQKRGTQEALRALDLEGLAGRPINEVFIALADHVCPNGGSVDEGIAREAFVETIIEFATWGVADLEALTPEQMDTFFETYVTHTIEARIYNDIGSKGIVVPEDVQAGIRAQQQLHEFIRNRVRDTLSSARQETHELTSNVIHAFVDSVYESAFSLLQQLGEAEATK